MKARIPPRERFTAKQREVVAQFAQEELDRQRCDLMRRFFKLMALALRDPLSPKGHGMGAVQICRVIDRISEYAGEYEQNKEFWEEADAVIERMGIPLESERL